MIKFRIAFVLFAFGALLATVSAQYGYGYQDSVNYFTTSVSDLSVSVSYVGGGVYTNGVPAPETGDALNITGDYGSTYYYYTEAINQSYDESAPYDGYASQFNGFNYYIDFTNTSGVDQTFGVEESLDEYAEIEGNSTAVSYGGFKEYGGAYEAGFNTLGLDGVVGYDDPENYDNYYYYYNNYYTSYYAIEEAESEGGFTDTLTPGETIEVQVWASGSTSVNSATPSPAAAIPFVLGLVARRRKV